MGSEERSQNKYLNQHVKYAFPLNFTGTYETEIINRKIWYFNIIFVLQLHFIHFKKLYFYLFSLPRLSIYYNNKIATSYGGQLSPQVKHRHAIAHSLGATDIAADENHPAFSNPLSQSHCCHLGLISEGLTQICQTLCMTSAFVRILWFLCEMVKEFILDCSLLFWQNSNGKIN